MYCNYFEAIGFDAYKVECKYCKYYEEGDCSLEDSPEKQTEMYEAPRIFQKIL